MPGGGASTTWGFAPPTPGLPGPEPVSYALRALFRRRCDPAATSILIVARPFVGALVVANGGFARVFPVRGFLEENSSFLSGVIFL